MTGNAEHNEKALQAVFEAFNRHDADGVMAHMSDDVVFETIGGDAAHGTRIEGREAVRAAFEKVWASQPDVEWADARHFATESRGVSEWRFRATQPDGTRIDADGCDLFRFRDGLIVEKKAFRKQRPPLAAT